MPIRPRAALIGAAMALGLALGTPPAVPAFAREAAAPARFTPSGLERIRQQLRTDVAQGRIPGAVLLITRGNGTLLEEAFGQQDIAAARPMRRDSIFRIASMTKPLVSVAAMQLVEQGKIQLNDPVSAYLPELQGLKVAVERRDAGGQVTTELVDARPITIQDLFRHTSGLTYHFLGQMNPVRRAYADQDIAGLYGPDAGEMLRRLKTIPLMYQPGSTFEYSVSTDILGHVVERVTGKSLDVALDEMVLRPLGMRDTVFQVTGQRLARLANARPGDPDTETMNWLDLTKPPKRFSGGAGAASTARDYGRFMRMLLNEGELDGVRLLSPQTIRYMMSDHLGPVRGPIYLPGAGHGFGLGFAVRTDQGMAATIGNRGEAWWGGITGTRFWVDPANDLGVVLMIQAPNQRNYYQSVMRNLVYGAMGRAGR